MNKKQKKKLRKIIISICLLVAVVLLHQFLISNLSLNKSAKRIILTIMYMVPYLIIGGAVLKKAGGNILRGQVFDENFLMSLATIGAFILGEYTEAAAVMIFYQVGELFENIAVNKSRNAITSLVALRPDYANIKKGDDVVKTDPYDVMVGDTIVVFPGEKIPLDGIVTDGESFINTAALTGETVPRRVSCKDTVLNGCINEQGTLSIEVTREFDQSTVAKILDMVENAGSKKSKSESFITRFARYYTPIVVIAALVLAFVPPLILEDSFSKWIGRALIFLVISCPCALVISVPLSFFGGIGAASKLGILIKGSNYLEGVSDASCVIFDKTGTLTEGVFKVNHIVTAGEESEEEILRLAAYAECYSNHPIARSIEKAFEEKGNIIEKEKAQDIKEVAGKGVVLQMDSDIIYAGNIKLMQENSIPVSEKIDINKYNGTIVYVAKNKILLGIIVIADVIKEEAKGLSDSLEQKGIKNLVMLTGDRESAALAVAKELHINEVHSELLPGDKLSVVEEIISKEHEKSKNSKVVFVGDGINDAPALIRADIGIAMGAMGQDAAIEAADIVIMDDNPAKLPILHRISKKTIAIVRQNIVFALGVKFIVMILGIFGIANMWLAVFADVGVSVIAILNSMRMLKFQE